jgi:hypothetical protein
MTTKLELKCTRRISILFVHDWISTAYNQVKDTELVKEPVVRIFLKLPMTAEDVEKIASGVEGDGLLGGCGTFKSLYQVFINFILARERALRNRHLQRTREEKAKGIHHTQKREMFAGRDFQLLVFKLLDCSSTRRMPGS